MSNVAEQQAALDRLTDRVVSCGACPRLVAWRNQAAAAPPAAYRGEAYWARPLPGLGHAGARLVVVGLAPAAHGGNRTGRLFTGDRSGDFLVAGLFRAGFASQPTSTRADDGLEMLDCYMTAPVRCAPPDNRPTPAERDTCLPYLAEELALLGDAVVYLALGQFAYDCLARVEPVRSGLPRPRARFAHGAVVRLGGAAEGRSIVCTYHPSQRNTFTGLLTPAMFDSVLAQVTELIAT